MIEESLLTTAAARVASVPFRLFGRRAFQPPRKALILKPCCLSLAMLTTPLVAALAETYPRAQFDWALSGPARPAVATNARVAELIDCGRVGLPDAGRRDVADLIERLREPAYDSCFIPDRSSLLAWVAWRAGIPQRIGLSGGGRGFAHTLAVRPPAGERHEAAIYLSLAQALGIETTAVPEFYVPDRARARMTALLVDEVDWLGDVPLVLIHPGGGDNPWRAEHEKRWPVERFTLLASQLVRRYEARILAVGAEADAPLAADIAGMSPAPVVNLAGRISLGELGALCEIADLYVGNDTGPTHVAAAVGAPTLAIFGPSDPAQSAPIGAHVETLWEAYERPFSWDQGATVEEAVEAAGRLLGDRNGHQI